MVEPVNLVLSSSLTTIRTLGAQLKPLEYKAIATELEAAPPPQTPRSVPGLGPVFSAGIVAEVGNVGRFEREESLAKFAGLTWRRHQSGEFEGEQRPLTKRPVTNTCATTSSRRPTRCGFRARRSSVPTTKRNGCRSF